VFCAGRNFAVGGISHDGKAVHWCTAREIVYPDAWNYIALVYEHERGDLHLYQPKHTTDFTGDAGFFCATRQTAPGPVHPSTAPLLFGALGATEPGSPPHWAHFNGKLAAPVLLGMAVDADQVRALQKGKLTREHAPVLGRWDFSRDVTTASVVDTSPSRMNGRAVNAPARAVTGPTWDGYPAQLYESAPQAYDAIHLHDDDLADAGWAPSVELSVPSSARSGVYAVEVSRQQETLYLPFIVRTPVRREELLFVLPTLTWQAYSNNTLPYTFTEDGVLDRGVCLYVLHDDGSRVHYATRRRPTRSLNPKRGFNNWGGHTLSADLYLVDWLETKGFGYDAVSDEDLHRDGSDLLNGYSCVVLGSHPEYWTEPMLDALNTYIASGGRVLYLGGNGLLWVTSIDPERPYIMEVRKWDEGESEETWGDPVGEYQHSTTLEVGGLWAHRGRPPRATVGVDFSAMMGADACDTAARLQQQHDKSWGYERLPDSYEPRYQFVFEGVDAGPIGDFGLNLGTAAGFEVDCYLPWPHKGEIGVLARAQSEVFAGRSNLPVPPVADITLLTLDGGGAVFAVGSVTWTGSLSHADYNNSVSRITENVLRRFLEREHGSSILDVK
jgi:N,N-dimethylformamidase